MIDMTTTTPLLLPMPEAVARAAQSIVDVVMAGVDGEDDEGSGTKPGAAKGRVVDGWRLTEAHAGGGGSLPYAEMVIEATPTEYPALRRIGAAWVADYSACPECPGYDWNDIDTWCPCPDHWFPYQMEFLLTAEWVVGVETKDDVNDFNSVAECTWLFSGLAQVGSQFEEYGVGIEW